MMIGQGVACDSGLRRGFVPCLLWVCLLAFSPVRAASIQLTDGEPVTGLFQISPDSQYVVYAATPRGGQSFSHLYSVPLRGGAATLLNSPQPAEPIVAYAVSPDGQRVVYQRGAALYSVPVAGPASASAQLNGVTLSSGTLHSFSISPDGRYVLYRTDADLYSVPIAGPADASILLNVAALLPAASSVPGTAAADFAPSPDGQWVVYVAQADTNAFSLYSVPADGPAAASVRLSRATPGADVTWFTVSADSQHVVYLSDQERDAIFQLYSVPLTGPADAGSQLNPPLNEGESVYNVAVSADAARVVYVQGYALYSVPIAGPASANVRLTSSQMAARIDFLALSANSQSAVFQAGDLYSVPVEGPASAAVNLTNLAPDGRLPGAFQISPDSGRVVYTAYATATSPLELYSVPLRGPSEDSVTLNRPLAAMAQPLEFQISPAGARVVYAAYQDADRSELYSVPIAGPAGRGVKLSGPEVDPGGIQPQHWQISPDGNHAVYAAGADLYVADTAVAPVRQYRYLPIMPCFAPVGPSE